MVPDEKNETPPAVEKTEKKPGPGRPKGSTTKRKPGRPVGSKTKKKNAKKPGPKKIVSKKTKKKPGRPKIVRVAIKTPTDLVAFMKDLDQKKSAGISAAKRIIRNTVEEIATTKDLVKEKKLITQLKEMKALVA